MLQYCINAYFHDTDVSFQITSASEKHVVEDNILFTNHF